MGARDAINGLSLQQEAFCQFYTSSQFGNATMAYALAYDVDLSKLSRLSPPAKKGKLPGRSEYDMKIDVCAACSSRLLTVVKIKDRVNELILARFNDTEVDVEHAKLLRQDGDQGVKLGAIREYNRVKGRVKGDTDAPPGVTPVTKIEIIMPKR